MLFITSTFGCAAPVSDQIRPRGGSRAEFVRARACVCAEQKGDMKEVGDEQTPLVDGSRVKRGGSSSGGLAPHIAVKIALGVLAVVATTMTFVSSGAWGASGVRLYLLKCFGSVENISDKALKLLNCRQEVNRVQPSVYLLGVQKVGHGRICVGGRRGRGPVDGALFIMYLMIL